MFNTCSAKIFKAIQPEADTLIWSLFSEKLISSDVRKKACESGKAACATLLLDSVGTAIDNSPANFDKFLSILRREAVFEDMVKDVQEALTLAVEKRQRSRLSSPSSAKSYPVPSTLPLHHREKNETLVMVSKRPPVFPEGSEVVGAVRNTSGMPMATQQGIDMLHNTFSSLKIGSNRSIPHSATTRDMEQQDSALLSQSVVHVQETVNPFQMSAASSTTSPAFTLTTATPQSESVSQFRTSSNISRSKSEESTESSCDEEARELIEIFDGNIDQLDKLKKRLQEKKQKYKLRKRIYRTQLEGKERELMRLEELIERERDYNSTNKVTIDFLMKQLQDEKERARVAENERRQLQQNVQNPNVVYELEHWKKAYENAMSEVKIRNAEIVRLQQQIDYLLQQGPLTPVDSNTPP